MRKADIPASWRCKDATKRHKGVTISGLQRMCQRGKYLLDKYGSREKIPLVELRLRPYLFAVKHGKHWEIPTQELDRHFLAR